jgi:hypothetical protein
MRTLIKQADPGALALMGFPPARDIAVVGPDVAEPVVPLGGELVFDATVTNHGTRAASLAIDYVIHYRKANGTLAPKVFKLTTKVLAPGGRITISKRHSFKPISTRRHYPGRHAVELQVNGARSGSADFDVVAS